jgi:hypothetical protein
MLLGSLVFSSVFPSAKALQQRLNARVLTLLEAEQMKYARVSPAKDLMH